MNYLNKFLAGFAVVALAASCTNEEPANGGFDYADGASAILKINIKGTTPGSRANSDKEEGAYDYGTLAEQKVTTANFFFFDADGIYVAQADLWTGGGTDYDNDKPSVGDNIDFKSENLLILKGLTQKHAPKYLVTVLNGGNSISTKMITGVSTLNEFRETITKEWNYTTTKDTDGKDLLVMSTSSHVGQGDSWGCTELKDGDLQVLNKADNEIKPEDVAALTPVQVYVERLAAKYTMATAAPIKVTLTLAGDDNTQIPGSAIGAEEVYVTIDGFGIVNAADKSYLMKHLVTPANASTWTDWNNDNDHRCFWAKSLYYDETGNTGLENTKLAKVAANSDFEPVYSNENTKPFAALQLANASNRVNASLTTNVVFTATVTKNADGTGELDLVNYNGVFYHQDQFIKYVLNRMNSTQGQPYSGLNFYKKVDDSYETTDEKTHTVTITGAKYAQVESGDFKKVRRDPNVLSGAEFTYETTLTELYAYDAVTNTCTLIVDGATKLNQQIRSMFDANPNVSNSTANYPVSYTGGATYYTVPVEHLIASTDKVVTTDGQFGIVRNHWYNFTVTKIMNLGHGVFNPNDVQDGDVIETPEDPKEDKYAMACQVNILSWKVVEQDIEL